MYVLNDLWHGNITPSERYIRSNSEYQKNFSLLCEQIELFLKDLSPEKRKHYDELESLQLNLIGISEEDSFIAGFRLGARMILDVIGKHDGQFETPADV